MSAGETIHVAYGMSRADSIRDALRSQGCGERVIGLSGALNYGPIDPPDPDVRQAWIRTVLRCDPCDDRREPEEPWAEATAAGVHPVFWVCKTDPGEHAIFLEFAFRMAGRPFDIVDATGLDITLTNGLRTPWSLGQMRPGEIVASGLREKRRPLTPAEREEAAAAWAQLRREDAPLRVVRAGRLVSAPLTQFDAALASQAMPDWEVAARLIGRTLEHLSVEVEPRGQSPGEIVLFGRILTLGDAGGLEVRGPGPGMRDYEVRRPANPRGTSGD